MAELVADFCHLRIPHIECHRGLVAESTADLLQQHVALLDDSIEFQSQRVVLQCQRHEDVVEKSAPAAGAFLHHGEIVGREHCDSHDSQQVTRSTEFLTIDEHAIAAVSAQLQLDENLAPIVVNHRGPNDR